MSKIYNSITELVGKTPIVEFNNLKKALGLKGRIAGKLEYFNPAGSHKDRPALEIIEEAEKRGEIEPGKTTLVEFTSGNMGIGIAAIAAAKGYKFKVGIQEGVSVERKKLLESYGAEIVNPPKELIAGVFEKGIEAFNDVYQWMLDSTPNSWTTRQLSNPDNVGAHYKHTAPEIWEDTDGKVDIFVGGVGTGGSTHGISKFLKEKNSAVKVVIAQPDKADVENPVVQGVEDGGFHGIHAVHDENGLNPMAPTNFSDKYVDEYETITYAETLRAIHLLAHHEGIFIGASSGAALAIAIKQALKDENKDKLIVPLLPDNGERYLSEDLQRVRPDVEKKASF
ncbi:MAG: cysteine synthase family protein [Treponema sp.]|uniref:PLP-dependent cysteine synthase family protein n=1 Tax=Treponema sp. TaxID=166 RepID=UPI00298E7B38|nr:cysteine synthase family protein [Treponema sp.]MBR5934069.1 cysteine synthase family protein [Treponema sp.]